MMCCCQQADSSSTEMIMVDAGQSDGEADKVGFAEQKEAPPLVVEKTVEPEPVVEKATHVAMSMTLDGVDYNSLASDEITHQKFKEMVKMHMADEASVSPDDVGVMLSSGSVKIDTIVKNSRGPLQSVQSKLSMSDTLLPKLVENVRNTPGMEKHAKGDILVSNCSSPVFEEKEVGDLDAYFAQYGAGAPAPVSAAVQMVFEDQGGYPRTVEVRHRPLGLWFEKQVPVKIGKVRGEFAGALEAGIEPGWTLKSISANGQTIDLVGLDYPKVMANVDAFVKPLPMLSNAKSVKLVCRDGATDVDFDVHWKPLGLEFTKGKLPMTVEVAKEGSYGVLLGIKKGMQFKSIGGVDLMEVKDYSEALGKLRDGVKDLTSLEDNKMRSDAVARRGDVSCR